ncbi:thrombospondin, partial [Vibrio sp. PNB22_2_2]
MFRKSQIAIAIGSSLVLSACGGGEDTSPSPEPSNTLTVTVIDGYLQNAKVWLEKKDAVNYLLEEGEINGTTDETGKVTLDISGLEDISEYQLISLAEAGVAIDLDHGKPIAKSLMMSAYQGDLVTPLTTLLEAKVRTKSADANSSGAYQEALLEVAQELGVSESSIVSDYIASESAEAKKVQQSALSLVASQAMPSSVQEMLQADVIVDESEQVKLLVKEIADDQIVIKDATTGLLTPVVTQDSDGDRIIDDLDAFPFDENEWYDSDEDGVGDNSDAFPSDPSESKDSDKDGVGDNSDA